MALSENLRSEIEIKLKNILRNKFKNYNPEPSSMPFHTRLLGKDKMALYKFIQSLLTTFGTSVFEPIAALIAAKKFKDVITHYKPCSLIDKNTLSEIQNIMDDLISANMQPNKLLETKRIKDALTGKEEKTILCTKVDLYLKDYDNKIYMIELKTAKPNFGGFKEFKRTLLEWTAVSLYNSSDENIEAFLAIPYNPYEPRPYDRWTLAGLMDLKYELKVGSEFWNFLGGDNTYEELLSIFEKVGIEMKEEINNYFLKYN